MGKVHIFSEGPLLLLWYYISESQLKLHTNLQKTFLILVIFINVLCVFVGLFLLKSESMHKTTIKSVYNLHSILGSVAGESV